MTVETVTWPVCPSCGTGANVYAHDPNYFGYLMSCRPCPASDSVAGTLYFTYINEWMWKYWRERPR